jgi:hypothetical protein
MATCFCSDTTGATVSGIQGLYPTQRNRSFSRRYALRGVSPTAQARRRRCEAGSFWDFRLKTLSLTYHYFVQEKVRFSLCYEQTIEERGNRIANDRVIVAAQYRF